MFPTDQTDPLASRRGRWTALAILSLSFLLIPLVAPAAEPNGRRIVLENRTYSVMWFRNRSATSDYSDWTKLLPGTRLRYENLNSMIVDVAESDGARREFTLSGGTTYKYDRTARTDEPGLSSDFSDGARGRWQRPTQPPTVGEFSGNFAATSGGDPRAFQPLENFMDRCQTAGESCKLSLKQLAIECYLAQQNGGIPDDLRYVKGFTWFFGYVVDRTHGDVILLGVKDPTRPPIDLDCLATAIMAAHFNLTPACSLEKDPDPQYQASIVRGVPWETKWAEIMIDADYRMKQVCQGQIDPHIAGLKSDFDRSLYRPMAMNTNSHQEDRWWFNFDSRLKRALVSSQGDVAVLYRNPVIVSTEKNLDGKYGTGATDDDAVQFAADFTNHMDELGRQYQSVGQLSTLFRLHDLFYHLKHVGGAEAPALKYWLEIYQRPYAGPAHQMPTLTRTQTLNWKDSSYKYTRTLSVRGGVSMKLGIGEQTLERTAEDESLKSRILSR